MPEMITYDPATKRLHVGSGYVEQVPQAVWDYEVSGKQFLKLGHDLRILVAVAGRHQRSAWGGPGAVAGGCPQRVPRHPAGTQRRSVHHTPS
jgi:hypothetical protein